MPKPIKVGKTMYRFAIPAVRYKGKKITAQDVADNKDLAAELAALGSGMLAEVSACALYTSDAADEHLRVDPGGHTIQTTTQPGT